MYPFTSVEEQLILISLLNCDMKIWSWGTARFILKNNIPVKVCHYSSLACTDSKQFGVNKNPDSFFYILI